MPRAKKTVHLRGNWSEEELQRAFDRIKFANCSVNAVSKEHAIPRRTVRGYLIFSSPTFWWKQWKRLHVGSAIILTSKHCNFWKHRKPIASGVDSQYSY